MKLRPFLVLLCLCCALPAFAADWPAACGADSQQFKVKTAKAPLPAAGDAAKSRIVFVETLDGDFAGGPIVRLAVDGTWVTAVKGKSFAVVEVQPGAHHLCGSRQSGIKLEKENLGVVKLDAEAGKTYFYNFKITRTEIGSPEMATGGAPGSSMTAKQRETEDTIDFRPVDADAALTLIKKLPQSTAAAK